MWHSHFVQSAQNHVPCIWSCFLFCPSLFTSWFSSGVYQRLTQLAFTACAADFTKLGPSRDMVFMSVSDFHIIVQFFYILFLRTMLSKKKTMKYVNKLLPVYIVIIIAFCAVLLAICERWNQPSDWACNTSGR